MRVFRLLAAAVLLLLPVLALSACNGGDPDGQAHLRSTASPPDPLQAGGGGGGGM